MADNKELQIDIKNIILGQVVGTNYKQNVNQVICKSNKPTSAELKCSLLSNLGSLKLVSDITFPFSSLNFGGFSTEINFKLDQDYNIASNLQGSGAITRSIHLYATSNWQLYDNVIKDHELSSIKMSNQNSLEAVIPPSSCFNLTMKDNINTITINYDATAAMIAYQNGAAISGTELESLVSEIASNNTVNNIQAITPISGSITFNIVASDFGELTPCD